MLHDKGEGVNKAWNNKMDENFPERLFDKNDDFPLPVSHTLWTLATIRKNINLLL